MIALPSRVAYEDAAALSRSLHAQILASSAAQVQMDAAALTQFDSSVLAVLLDARRSAQAAGKSFAVLHLPPKLTQLAALYGVAELLQ